MQGKTLDLTEGRPITRILLFAVPLILGTLFQQMYSFADTLMVGRLVGTDALAAVGATYSLGFLTLGFVQGTCVGFSIPLSQSFGAKRPDEFKRYFAGGLQLCAALALVMTALMTAFCAPLLRLMRTPEDIFAMTQTYATVIFLGIPASILYNFCAGALRAAGDSRHPFYFLLFSTALNIALDYMFIVPLSLGVFGAALATVLSLFFCLHGGLMIMRNTLQGMGYSVQAVFSGFMELAGRSLGSVLCLAGLGYLGVCLSNPLAFGFAFAYCALRVHAELKKRQGTADARPSGSAGC